jgi:hypothetical protein
MGSTDFEIEKETTRLLAQSKETNSDARTVAFKRLGKIANNALWHRARSLIIMIAKSAL